MSGLFSGKELLIYLASLGTLAIGLGMTYSQELPEYLMIFPAEVQILVLAIVTFAFGFMFFGYPSPAIMFFAGVHLGGTAKAAGAFGAYSILGALSCALIAFSSVKLGTALLEDLAEKGNFKKSLRISLIFLAIALAVAAVTDFAVVT